MIVTAKSSQVPVTLLTIPSDVQQRILMLLSCRDVSSVSRTCKILRAVVQFLSSAAHKCIAENTIHYLMNLSSCNTKPECDFENVESLMKTLLKLKSGEEKLISTLMILSDSNVTQTVYSVAADKGLSKLGLMVIESGVIELRRAMRLTNVSAKHSFFSYIWGSTRFWDLLITEMHTTEEYSRQDLDIYDAQTFAFGEFFLMCNTPRVLYIAPCNEDGSAWERRENDLLSKCTWCVDEFRSEQSLARKSPESSIGSSFCQILWQCSRVNSTVIVWDHDGNEASHMLIEQAGKNKSKSCVSELSINFHCSEPGHRVFLERFLNE